MPHDAHFPNLIAGTTRHHEQFNIEREPPDGQARKQRVGRFRAEQLEATLGIRDPRQHQQPHVCIEDAPDRMAKPVLTHPLRPVSLARPHHDVGRRGVAEGADKSIQIVGRHRQVGVRHEAPGPARVQHPAPNRGALPFAMAPDRPDARVLRGVPLHDRGRPIGAPVIDDEDFPCDAQSVQVGAQVDQTPSDGGGFVEGWNDDREVRRRGRRDQRRD